MKNETLTSLYKLYAHSLQITEKEAALESLHQENGLWEEESRTISHADNSLCYLSNDNKTGLDFPDNKLQDETQTLTDNNTLESSQSQQPRELDSQAGETVMEVDAADNSSERNNLEDKCQVKERDKEERNNLDNKSQIEEGDREDERRCDSIENTQMVQTTDKPKENTEESSAPDEHIEDKMETNSQMPGQEQLSSNSSMPENSSNMSLNKYKS